MIDDSLIELHLFLKKNLVPYMQRRYMEYKGNSLRNKNWKLSNHKRTKQYPKGSALA
jgi:hypothetical protein